MEEYEDDGTWIWVSFAPEYRLIIAHHIGKRKQKSADKIINTTKERLSSLPLFSSDGLFFYTHALVKAYGYFKKFKHNGKRGRPKKPKWIPYLDLKYGQVVKHRNGGRLASVKKRIIFGKNINLKDISTSLLERQNLTFRQDNNRISRKTIGFSKEEFGLDDQITLYCAHFNFCRKHRSLSYFDEGGKKRLNSPAKEYGLIDHNWSLKELLTFPYHKTSTN